MLDVKRLTGGYGGTPVVRSVSFKVEAGTMLGILGPNGSGKSTLLKMLSGLLPADSGSVEIGGKPISGYSRKAFARQVAVLPQLQADAFSHTVYQTVSLGRYPHQAGLFAGWTDADERAVQKAMDQMGVTKYRDTEIEFMSGGERQRVFVAQALAQEAPVLLLDEPTNHLDIAHQQQLLDTIRRQATQNGLTVVSVFHDVNLASLYCDRLLLMNRGEVAALGTPDEVIDEQKMETVYAARVRAGMHPEIPKPQITLLPANEMGHEKVIIRKSDFSVSGEYVHLDSRMPLKTVSSAVYRAGAGWFRHFVNRKVGAAYITDDAEAEMRNWLHETGFPLTQTVAMMTAAMTEDAVIGEYGPPDAPIVICVTAGVGNAVDASLGASRDVYAGTINTWVIVNGHLSEEAMIQGMITATEAKAKAMQTEQVLDPLTGTVATGTSTDSLLISATQTGICYPYAGTVTELGKAIGSGVFECTAEAIRRYRRRKADLDGSGRWS
ncbi:adenosylcobinamide amidohydrolase [Bhargavaea beijingensis]|uniref:ATP-binding cassette domain-containing protein n=1 Tax=Bhargavaea beijingensis TaxID=426756 RepID=A0A1G7DTE7_9BACL|nr:adenosylcobinamide amidohydrolase [Bhargavaea beijingensis]MCW1928928.1 adenosylcobinamide amidohydrolase [Bhargavaea beijingensis]RSK30006.1 ATP-binding cassette domain-containing protein [Bhargavaea beijingensis]SDE54195.1 iron complex transport system ATP-binding protein [Bhargavaea beijingensis]